MVSLAVAMAIFVAAPAAHAQSGTRWVKVEEIYADGEHNAWPDMCRWKGRYYVMFPARGASHRGGHGVMILASTDAQKWEEVLSVKPGQWLLDRDEVWPAETVFFLPTKDRLFVLFCSRAKGDMNVLEEKKAGLKKQWMELGGSDTSFKRWVNRHGTAFRTRVTYSEDGRTWRKPQPLLENGWWLWRPATFKGRHYMVGYRNHAQQWSITPELKSMIPRADSVAPLNRLRGKGMELFNSASLFVSDDGLKWDKVSDIAANDDTEPGINFSPTGRALVVSRNGAALKYAIAYVSDPPYKKWTTLKLDRTIQQPAVLYHKKRWIVGGRYVDSTTLKRNRFDPRNSLEGRIGTRLWYIDDNTGKLTEIMTVPSWGDCGQPGILLTPGGDLLVSYYSCSQTIDVNLPIGGGKHPGKISPCSIYLARVVIE